MDYQSAKLKALVLSELESYVGGTDNADQIQAALAVPSEEIAGLLGVCIGAVLELALRLSEQTGASPESVIEDLWNNEET